MPLHQLQFVMFGYFGVHISGRAPRHPLVLGPQVDACPAHILDCNSSSTTSFSTTLSSTELVIQELQSKLSGDPRISGSIKYLIFGKVLPLPI
jgi:hypothetical protein